MDIIHLLPDSVANQIAAGEVIQRPASCLKELVENSLDAGASRIQVIVHDAGRTLLQVIDDGCGMSETDARMAFERHATSKISQANDLFHLRTMGFRGEALASICAVAQVEVTTRRKEDEMGTRLEIAGSDVISQELCQCPVGTNFKVKNLFFNVPVRRKFLKTDQTELRNLLTEFYHIVLVYPKVQFTFVHNDEILLDLPAGTEKQRIEAVYGKGTGHVYTAGFVEVNTDTDLISIRGFVSKPEMAGKNPQQYFFVNGRYMRHPYFQKAVQTAYSGMLPGDYQPSFFIYFDIDPESIDVNIHPTKTEIKFSDEQTIFQILLAAVREALGKFELAPKIDFDREGELDMPVSTDRPASAPKVMYDPNYNPFKTRGTVYSNNTSVPRSWEQLYASVPSSGMADATTISSSSMADATTISSSSMADVIPSKGMPDDSELFVEEDSQVKPWQYAGRYIFVPSRLGLMLVNQHRAHVCVLYKELLDQFNSSQRVSQQLLFPEVLELTADDMVLMDTLLEDLRSIGFDLVQFGKYSYSVNGVPGVLGDQNVLLVLQHILLSARETGANVRVEWRKQIALSLAEDSAIPYGKTLNDEEIKDLIKRLFALSSYRVTPRGKRVVAILTDDELKSYF